jgi:hypothetical protein
VRNDGQTFGGRRNAATLTVSELRMRLQRGGKPASIGLRLLALVKDWGGVATVAIAILYTFPFDAFDRYIRWSDYAVVETRKAISDIATLRGEWYAAVDKATDRRVKEWIGITYNARVFNLITSNISRFSAAKNKLYHSELLLVASDLADAGLINDALPYYDLALVKATAENPTTVITIYRERGRSLFQSSAYQNKDEARRSYAKSLGLLAEQTKRGIAWSYGMYLGFLGELVKYEFIEGDWQCGKNLDAYFFPLLQQMVKLDDSFADLYQSVRGGLPTGKGTNQTEIGCDYVIPPADFSRFERGIAALPGPLWPNQLLNKSEGPRSPLFR